MPRSILFSPSSQSPRRYDAFNTCYCWGIEWEWCWSNESRVDTDAAKCWEAESERVKGRKKENDLTQFLATFIQERGKGNKWNRGKILTREIEREKKPKAQVVLHKTQKMLFCFGKFWPRKETTQLPLVSVLFLFLYRSLFFSSCFRTTTSTPFPVLAFSVSLRNTKIENSSTCLFFILYRHLL